MGGAGGKRWGGTIREERLFKFGKEEEEMRRVRLSWQGIYEV